MSLDYDDPSLDSLLTEHARRSRAEFTPPGLDGMLGAALDSSRPHRRWVWPVLAAVILLVIPLITVLLVRHGRIDGQPARPSPKLVVVGPVPWTDPVWNGHSIYLTVSLTHAQYCMGGVPDVQAKVTADGATSVTIVATEYLNPDPAAESSLQKDSCSSGSGPATYTRAVDLSKPLNGRVAVDGTSHTTFRVLDASSVPTIPGLPSAFHSGAYWGSAEHSVVGRSWYDQRVQIHLSIGKIDRNEWPTNTPSTIGLVNGQETRILDLLGYSIAWKHGANEYAITEEPLGGKRDYEFSPEQLLELARSVR
jgi:hypothetical protein